MVHIKNIGMTGFKSFGNSKTVIKLAPGFTCIVGPNGSGKSNAIDALNFCLGTLSKKSMRAEKLTDLLFNGIKGKDPAKKTIVEIELDNSDLKIPVNEETVVISRELKRNGSSVYRFNGKRTTRTDILDKLRVAGIDCIDGFNIIQQGQIGEIVGMSTIQRRELLEGVAGIGQFEDKKEAAIAELDVAQRKMGELNLLISELTTRVDQLRNEKESAEKWVELGGRIKRLRSELLSLRLDTIKKEINNLNEDVNRQNQVILGLENEKQGLTELKKLEEDVNAKQEKIEELEKQRTTISEGLSDAKIELVKLEQQLEFNKDNKENKEQDVKKIESDKHLTTATIEEKQKEIIKITKQLQIINKQKEDLTKKRSQMEKDILEKESEFKEAQEEYEKIATHIRSFNEDITAHKVSKDISASIVQGFQETKEKKQTQILDIEKSLEVVKSKVMSTQKDIDRDTSKLEELQQRITLYEEDLTQHDEKTEKEIKKHTEELIVIKTKIDMIKASISKEETDETTRYILENKKEFPGIKETLESVLGGEEKVPKALRYLKNALIAENLPSALKCIRKLKENVIGSCVFIPLTTVGILEQNLADKLEEKVTSSIIIVEDIGEAIEVREKHREVQIQTLEGDIFYPNGLIDGGFHRSAAVDQLTPLVELQKSEEEDISRLAKEKAMQDVAKSQIDKAKEITNEAVMNLEKNIRDSIIQLKHLKERNNQENDQLNRFSSELKEIEKDEMEKKIELGKINQEIEELEVSKEQIERRLEEARIGMESLDVSGLREQRSRLSEKIIQIEKQKIRTEERRNSFEGLIIPSNQRIKQLKIRNNELYNDIENLKKKEKEIADGIKDTIELIWQREQELQGVDEEIKKEKNEIVELRRETKKRNRVNSKIEKDIQASREKISELKIRRAKLDTERESLINEVKDKELEIFEVKESFIDRIIPKDHQREISDLSKVQKNLEPVNMRSIEGFQVQNKRLQEAVDTKKVLNEERKVILDVIAQLEVEKINTFMRTFNKINQAYNEIFQELANGNARLILENPEDVFEGGVSIEAHPDGKTLKTLESMSGGEKALTALAFIFAIQQSEPQPFYVLDEIDATLDVKNVDKVGRLLAKMSKGTSEFGHAQFIVISHRDILMAKSESIYGTTNVNGITKIMQLQLDEKGLSTA